MNTDGHLTFKKLFLFTIKSKNRKVINCMSGGLRKECSEVQLCGNMGTTSALVGNAWQKDGLVNLIGMSQPGPCLLPCPVLWAVCSFSCGAAWPLKWWCKSRDISHTPVPVYNVLSTGGWLRFLHSGPPFHTKGKGHTGKMMKGIWTVNVLQAHDMGQFHQWYSSQELQALW